MSLLYAVGLFSVDVLVQMIRMNYYGREVMSLR